MDVDRYTHVIFDDDCEPIGAVRDFDELEDGRQFGIVQFFDWRAPPTYMWLRELQLLPLDRASPLVRGQVTFALADAGDP